MRFRRILAIWLVIASTTLVNPSFSESKIVEHTSGEVTTTINYDLQEDDYYLIRIEKGSQSNYFHMSANVYTAPLQFGNGEYKITLLQKVEGKIYKKIHSETINVRSNKNVFKSKITSINWSEDDMIIKSTKDKTVVEIHKYISDNFKYDSKSYDDNDLRYVVDIDKINESKKGACLDFSVLFASIMRSKDIPCKVVYGTTIFNSEFHAWNEVYVDGEWRIVDLTLDVSYKSRGWSYETFKDNFFYNKESEY